MALLIQTWLTLELNCVIKGFTGPVAQIFFSGLDKWKHLSFDVRIFSPS